MPLMLANLSLSELLAILLVALLVFRFRYTPWKEASGINIADELTVWLARGFDVGLLPKGPGTWGSIVGVVWFLVLVSFGRLDAYVIGMLLGVIASVWLCERAEKILKQHDPSSVVIDEIIALPICFLPWVLALWRQHQQVMPEIGEFFRGKAWLGVLGVFGLFRLFDIWKPGPIGKIQNLRGGLGVTADDVLAAVVVAALVGSYIGIRGGF